MANKDAAFGLRPIGKVGQNRDAQGLSEYDIAASASAIYFRDTNYSELCCSVLVIRFI